MEAEVRMRLRWVRHQWKSCLTCGIWEEVVANYDPRAEHWRSQILALGKYVS